MDTNWILVRVKLLRRWWRDTRKVDSSFDLCFSEVNCCFCCCTWKFN